MRIWTASVRRRIAMLASASAVAVASAGAASTEAGGEDGLCRNKASLLARYLGSDSIAEIVENGSPASVELIERARAINESYGSDVTTAEGCTHIDEALRLVSAAVFQSGARPPDAEEQRARYVERARQFDAYLQAISLSTRNAWPQEVRRRFAAAELKSADAAARAGEGDYGRADEAIEAAYREMLEIVRALNDGKMVVHELVFNSPEEEYRYEKERNRSYEMLLQIAVEEPGASDELRAHIARMIAQNNLRRRAADAMSTSGDAAAAIRALEAASRDLAKTLRLTGVMVWE